MNPFSPPNASANVVNSNRSRWRFVPAAICLLVAVFFGGNGIVVAALTLKSLPDISNASRTPLTFAALMGVLMCVIGVLTSLYSTLLSLRGHWGRAALFVTAVILAAIVGASMIRVYLGYAVP